MASTILVVPCYDEAHRLPVSEFLRFAEKEPEVSFLFVNDGSRDATLERLRELEGRDTRRFAVLDLQPNRGKAEAVRHGMLAALEREPSYVGYWDADLSTPLEEVPRFVEVLEQRPACLVVFGARVKLLGRSIERRAVRHYLGRIFATLASQLLALPIYDTQCGAKLFRAGPETRGLFAEPFSSRWIFDVEIVARLMQPQQPGAAADATELVYELPLRRWHDVPGSKVRPTDALRAVADLARIRRRYRASRQSRAGSGTGR